MEFPFLETVTEEPLSIQHIIPGLPYITTSYHDSFTTPEQDGDGTNSAITTFVVSDVHKYSNNMRSNTGISPYFLGSISLVNILCIVIFIPVNVTILRRFRQISTRDQPMFIFFAAVQCVCIVDLFICTTETIVLWTTVPQWTCQALGTLNLSVYFFLSIVIASICIYR